MSHCHLGLYHSDYRGCFKYYLNYLGFGMKSTWPKYDSNYEENMRILTYSFAIMTFLTILFIINMQRLAYKKHKVID